MAEVCTGSYSVLRCGHLRSQQQHLICKMQGKSEMVPRQLEGQDALKKCIIAAYLEESGRAALALLACKLSWQLRRHRPISPISSCREYIPAFAEAYNCRKVM